MIVPTIVTHRDRQRVTRAIEAEIGHHRFEERPHREAQAGGDEDHRGERELTHHP